MITKHTPRRDDDTSIFIWDIVDSKRVCLGCDFFGVVVVVVVAMCGGDRWTVGELNEKTNNFFETKVVESQN